MRGALHRILFSYPLFELRFAAFCVVSYFLLGFFAIYILAEKAKEWAFWLFIIPYLIIALPFVILDVAYNLVVGTILFLDWPREWLFTDRLKRYERAGYRAEWTDRFTRNLNALDPGHV